MASPHGRSHEYDLELVKEEFQNFVDQRGTHVPILAKES